MRAKGDFILTSDPPRILVWLNAVRLRKVVGSWQELSPAEVAFYPRLEGVLGSADKEHDRIISRYPEVYYDLFLTPCAVKVTQKEGEAIAKLLNCKAADLGIRGPSAIGYAGKYYKVWIYSYLCG